MCYYGLGCAMAQQTKCAYTSGSSGDGGDRHHAPCNVPPTSTLAPIIWFAGRVAPPCVATSPPPPPHMLQLGAHQHTCVTIGVDGTNRRNWGYVRCTLGAPSCGPNDLASWWMFESVEARRTLFSLQNECDCDGKLRAVTMASLPHDDGGLHAPLFFLWADTCVAC